MNEVISILFLEDCSVPGNDRRLVKDLYVDPLHGKAELVSRLNQPIKPYAHCKPR